MADDEPSAGAFNKVKRMPERGRYDEATAHKVIDDCLVCHVAFKLDDDDEQARQEWPVVLPMAFGREGDKLFLHGHLQSRLLKALSEGRTQACLTFTTIDSFVLARSAFHNDFRFSSCMVFGTASLLPQADLERKVAALTSITNHAFKRVGGDRWNDCRMATDAEIKSTRVVEVQIELASAKVIIGGPDDEKSDLDDPKVRQGVWAGELVLKQGFAGIRQSGVGVTAPVPDYVKAVLAA